MPVDLKRMETELPPEFSAQDAVAFLADTHRAPLKYLASIEKKGLLVRLKRGLYTFAGNVDRLAAANSIHGPSYVSFETALGHYGLIPERTDTVMSVVDGRTASFSTPIGTYEFHSQSRGLFADGMTMARSDDRAWRIATREKALLDTLWRAQLRARGHSGLEILEYVVDGLRVDAEQLQALSRRRLRRLAGQYRSLAPRKLCDALRRRANGVDER